ncbi:hypothetical protein KUTeg_022865 [Tegillarca granosa]|uniref:Uncharacterized protein n=1 Tax=Tegillarca granosa TaxID=220873 RepID=A0ABQ9E0Z6_TEGGR|nr:hypothetical protein KUTeg_022865 [Tegillarca granosa]
MLYHESNSNNPVENEAGEEYRPNRVILTQGRCRCNRRVFIPEAGKEVLFYLCCKEQGEFFGEECVLDNEFIYNTVTTSTYVVCYRLHIEQYKENMLRFKEKGFCYEPVRPRTAVYRRPKSTASLRARSAARARTTSPRMFTVMDDVYDSDQESQVTEHEEPKETQSTALSKELEKILQQHGDKNSVLATMKSEDIVRKAMAMAEKKAESMKRNKKSEEDEWSTVLHAENRQAKFLISVNKMKVAELKKQLDDIENRRMNIAMKQQKKKALQENFNSNNELHLNDKLLDKENSRTRLDLKHNEQEYRVSDTTDDLTSTERNQSQMTEKMIQRESSDELRLKVIDDEDWSESIVHKLDNRLRPIDDLSMQTTNIYQDQHRAISARF